LESEAVAGRVEKALRFEDLSQIGSQELAIRQRSGSAPNAAKLKQ
jgi:hypothetical protein